MRGAIQMTLTWQERYQRVQDLMRWEDFVANGVVFPRWIDRDHLWWTRSDSAGREVRVSDGAGEVLHTVPLTAIARAVSKEIGADVDADHVVLNGLDVALDPLTVSFDLSGRSWAYDPAEDLVAERPGGPEAALHVSPDGTRAVLQRENDLWLRDMATGAERRLTSDGSDAYAYATPCAARRVMLLPTAKPEGLWSPDSRLYFTLQADDRHVPELVYVDYATARGDRPRVLANRTSLPSDPKVTEFRLLVLDVDSDRQVEARHPRLSLVRMNDTIFSGGMAWWSTDSRTAWFVDIERGERAAHVVAMGAATGSCRTVMTERSDVPLELSVNVYTPALIKPLPETDELVWYSEKTGRGHLYLVDLTTGNWKRPITAGEWQVRDVLTVDPLRREVALLAGGLDATNPYLRRPAIASLDSGELTILSDSPGDHQVWRPREFGLMAAQLFEGVDIDRVSGFSPDGELFVETVGAIGQLPTTVLRRRGGEHVAVLEDGVATGLPPWFTWPEPFTVKAADGETDLHGLLFFPPDHDSAQSYPLIDLIYGGPQVSHTPVSGFMDPITTGTLCEAAGYAQLGGFAVIVDGRGTAMRDRAFRHHSLGAVQRASDLGDHEAAIRALAARHPSIDLGSVGMTGFSGGGYATALAAFTRGDFFRVTVAGGGNYDQGLFWHGWGERYHGAYNEALYSEQAAASYAAGLQGQLMLIHGLLDSGCHPSGLFAVVQALIETNKDVDLVLLPKSAHALPGYAVRRRLDHFVRHLFQSVPPQGVVLQGPHDVLIEKLTAQQVASAVTA